MTRPLTTYLAGAAFALTAAAGAAAFAQPPVPPTPDAGDHRQMREERQVMIRHGDDGDEHMMTMMRHGHEDAAEHLRTMLQLKPGQEAALTAYLAAVRPDHSEHIVEMSDHRDGKKTTTERLAEMDAHLNAQTTQAHARIAATRKFYDQLEPSQKKVFDEMPMLMMGPMGPMMHGGSMKVMVNMDGHGSLHELGRMPPLPPAPPIPPVPPRRDD
jgi:protein CpxP